MIIAHNISAINTYNKMGVSATHTDKAMEKLSSGYKINRAADDAAGLSISEKMRSQIRGLTQASTNAQNGVSMIQTAEGALNEAHSIMQRMRELAVQAANDTNAASDREALQSEMNQLTSEINRIGNTTEFNGMKLLNGSKVKIEAGSQDIQVTGKISGAGKSLSHTSGSTNPGKITLAGNGIELNNTTPVGIVDLTKLEGASGKNMITIKKVGDKLGAIVDLKENGPADAIHSEWQALTFDSATETYTYDNNGVKFAVTKDTYDYAMTNLGDGDTAATVDIFLALNGTASTALNANAKTIKLTNDYTSFAGGVQIKNIKLDEYGTNRKYDYDTINVEYNHSTATGTASTLKVEFLKAGVVIGTENLNFAGDNNNFGTTADPVYKYSFDTNGLSFDLVFDETSTNVKSGKTAAALDLIKLSDEQATVSAKQNVTASDNSVYFHVGANMDQVINTTFGDMRAAALGLTGTGEGYMEDFTVNNGSQSTPTERGLNISTRKGANLAIDKIDKAIQMVSTERSKYGAVQNRLEYTINNIDTTSENMTEAESTIRDTDMASEMMEMTKNQILQQASQAMLSQAMQRPQQVLQLLQQ
ncbi:MAG: hypothetical protein MJ246_01060 [Clostridia bacterium]|nr:hypothetical protein [Clostridia bacterium]